MSRSHFFKHLSYTLVHHHRPSYLSPPLSVYKFPHRWKKPSSSSLFSKSPISSSSSVTASPSTTTTSESSAYLSVLIRCPKHVAVSMIPRLFFHFLSWVLLFHNLVTTLHLRNVVICAR